MNADSLVVDLDNPAIGTRHHMLIGRRLIDLFDLPASPPILPTALRGLYGISEPGHIEIFADFADFVDELGLRLSEADRARSLAAYGRYDPSGMNLTTHRVLVHMLAAEAP
jgi:hypothetical protein